MKGSNLFFGIVYCNARALFWLAHGSDLPESILYMHYLSDMLSPAKFCTASSNGLSLLKSEYMYHKYASGSYLETVNSVFLT